MTIGIYRESTPGSGVFDVLEVPGDGQGIALGAVGEVRVQCLKAAVGYQNAETITCLAPIDCEVSSDGVSYGASVDYAAGGVTDSDGDGLLYTKRVSFTAYNAAYDAAHTAWLEQAEPRTPAVFTFNLVTGGVTAPRLALVAEIDVTAPVISGGITATPGYNSLALDWSDATDLVGATGYDVEYGTTAAYGTAVSPDPTASGVTITGLSALTLYYFRVRAYDAAGNAGTWVTGTATTTRLEEFNGAAGAPNAALWTVMTAGSGSAALNGSGKLVISTPATTDGAILYRKDAFNHLDAHLFKAKVRVNATPAAGAFRMDLLDHDHALAVFDGSTTGHPTAGVDSFGLPSKTTLTTDNDKFHTRLRIFTQDVAGALKWYITRGVAYNATGEDAGRYWNGTGWQEAAFAFDGAYDTDYVIAMTTGATFGMSIKSADESTTVAAVTGGDWSKVRPFVSATSMLAFGDEYSHGVVLGAALEWYDE